MSTNRVFLTFRPSKCQFWVHTDDEREALTYAIRKGSGASRYQAELLADQMIPHLRRTVQGEPGSSESPNYLKSGGEVQGNLQGEPSDAQVDAARGALPQFTPITRDHMRAALRAAAEAGGER